MEPKNDAKRLLEFLKQNSNIIPKFCDTCGTPHNQESIQLIGSKNGIVSCRIHCVNCGATHILNVSMPVNGVGVASRTPLNVDLGSVDEFNKFAGKSAVDANDAIDTYKSLNKMKGINDFLKAINHE